MIHESKNITIDFNKVNKTIAELMGYKFMNYEEWSSQYDELSPMQQEMFIQNSHSSFVIKKSNDGKKQMTGFNPESDWIHLHDVIDAIESHGWTINIWSNRCSAKNNHHSLINISRNKITAVYLTCYQVAEIILKQNQQ